MHALSIEAQSGEPLAAWFSPERKGAGAREQRFECASFGDRVSGRCWWPERAVAGLVLAVHALGRDKNDAALANAAASWSVAGFATAAIDLPLHGERHNAKLSQRAVAASAPGAQADLALWQGLLAQAVRDCAPSTRSRRAARCTVTCVAFGDAAGIALAFASLDARRASRRDRVTANVPARARRQPCETACVDGASGRSGVGALRGVSLSLCARGC
jgi:hypothetical protein